MRKFTQKIGIRKNVINLITNVKEKKWNVVYGNLKNWTCKHDNIFYLQSKAGENYSQEKHNDIFYVINEMHLQTEIIFSRFKKKRIKERIKNILIQKKKLNLFVLKS